MLKHLPEAIVQFKSLGAKTVSEILPVIKDAESSKLFFINMIIAALQCQDPEDVGVEIVRAAKAVAGIDVCDMLILSCGGPWMHVDFLPLTEGREKESQRQKTRADNNRLENRRKSMWMSPHPDPLLDFLREDSRILADIISSKHDKLLLAIGSDREGVVWEKATKHLTAAAHSISDEAAKWLAGVLANHANHTATKSAR